MKYRIDAVIQPTDLAVSGYDTSATEAKTTTKETAYDEGGLIGAVLRAAAIREEAIAYGLDVAHVSVVDESNTVVATVDAEHPNG